MMENCSAVRDDKDIKNVVTQENVNMKGCCGKGRAHQQSHLAHNAKKHIFPLVKRMVQMDLTTYSGLPQKMVSVDKDETSI